MERAYKTMHRIGVSNITVGIVIAVAGLAVGVISIITGAHLLKRKSELTF